MPDVPRRLRFLILREQVLSVPLLMLSAAAVFAFLTGAVVDALFIGGALVVNAALGFVTEDRAERAIQSLRRTRTPEAWVLREGLRTAVPVESIVPGDILLLEPGQIVAADARVLRSNHLLMDESLLTGENEARPKSADSVADGGESDGGLPLGDRINMLYAGSAVAAGSGAALVTATGMHTELGRIRRLIGSATDTPPPMTRELQKLGSTLAMVSLGVCGIYGLMGLWLGLSRLEVFALTASLAVSAIPEGLPTVSTTALALGMQRMRCHNVVVRRLPAVAALGSATLLCVDKTGTLTENRMRAGCFVFGDEEIEIAGKLQPGGLRFVHQGRLVGLEDDPRLRAALEIGALCTEAHLESLSGGAWEAAGSPTETALLQAALAAGLDVAQMQTDWPLLERKARAPGRNYMVSIHRPPRGADTEKKAFIKGAPEEVLALCSKKRTRDGTPALTPERRRQLHLVNEGLAGRGLRVLGLAQGDPDSPEWIGLVGLEDPLRGQARAAVAQLSGAGIRTLMLTGDQRRTAESVGRAAGLGQHGHLRVADGASLEAVFASGQPLPDVLARVSPEHKYDIVRRLQERGHIVIMTGDGVNDAPALKAADVGVAMGARSTEIARDLADVILLDDNLASLPLAVSQGRTIFTNIRKSLRFLLASNLADIALVGVCLVLGFPFPLTALQLLWMNLVSDVFPAIALAMEPAEADVMARPPRPPQEPLLTGSLWKIIGREAGVIAAVALGSYVWGMDRYGLGARARTIAFTTVCLSEVLYALACRHERSRRAGERRPSNRSLTTFLGLSAAAQVGTVALPPLRRLLGTTSLSPLDWLVVTASSGAVLGVTNALKRLPSQQTLPTQVPSPRAPQRLLTAPATAF